MTDAATRAWLDHLRTPEPDEPPAPTGPVVRREGDNGPGYDDGLRPARDLLASLLDPRD